MVGQGRSSTRIYAAVTHSISQAFKAIFISPTSTDNLGNEPQESSASRKCRCGDRQTHANIANLIGMQIVEPHAIAYVACQVCYQSNICSDCGMLSLSNWHSSFALPCHHVDHGLLSTACLAAMIFIMPSWSGLRRPPLKMSVSSLVSSYCGGTGKSWSLVSLIDIHRSLQNNIQPYVHVHTRA